jgi:hypothetical protein
MLYYSDLDLVKPVFSTLVINVSSIVEKFQSLENFVTKYDYGGETNGKLLVRSEMSMPAIHLKNFAEEELIPKGLVPNKDFVFVNEMLTGSSHGGPDYVIHCEHPDCININWLQSIIMKQGNFLWYSDPNLSVFEKDASFRLFKYIFFGHEYQIELNPRIFKIDDTYVHYTISNTKLHYKVHRDALWYNEEKYGNSKLVP